MSSRSYEPTLASRIPTALTQRPVRGGAISCLLPFEQKESTTFSCPALEAWAWFDSINLTYVTQYVARQVAYWGNVVQGLLTWQTLSVVTNNLQRHRGANHRRLFVYFEPRP
jgi:hypothetical protein